LSNVKLSDLFNGTGQFLSYAGGLTTPTCNEIVTWVVMTNIKPITQTTLDKFKQASANPPQPSPLISLYGNFRPIQPTGSRTIYSSDSANLGAACAAYTNPVFNCNSAAQAVFSPMILLFSLSAFMLSGR